MAQATIENLILNLPFENQKEFPLGCTAASPYLQKRLLAHYRRIKRVTNRRDMVESSL